MKSFVTVLVLGVLIVGGFYVYKNSSKTSGTDMTQTGVDKSDLIVVDTLASGAAISSLLAISGKARGTWYFEGSFPVTVVESTGVVIGQGIATAQGE